MSRNADALFLNWSNLSFSRTLGVSAIIIAYLAVTPAGAQPNISIDYQSGGTIGVVDGFFIFPGVSDINEGDILAAPFPGPPPVPGPFPPPPPANVGIFIFAGPSGLGPDLGLPAYLPPPYAPGIPNALEVDAFSYGFDFAIDPALPPHEAMFAFSVDEHAVSFPANPPPDVFSEGAFGVGDSAADVYVAFPPGAIPPFPAPPFGAGIGNTMLFDGDGVDIGGTGPALPGLPPAPVGTFFGIGLIEGPPSPYAVPDPGDNVDALEADFPAGPGIFPAYYSLDSGFPDPIEVLAPGPPPPNSGSAGANGFVGGDILVSAAPGGPPAVFAPAAALGLDIGGADTDDVDALVLVENGSGVYEQSVIDHDWVGGATDMLLFSVRRGSAIIGSGLLDSRFGLPIEEGDILTPPPAGSPPGTPPGIWMAAENIGLATLRMFGPPPLPPGTPLFPVGAPGADDDFDGITDNEYIADELDGLDVAADCDANAVPDTFDFLYGFATDCNGNGINDACDIASGVELDCNANSVPDSCDITGGFSLDCDGNAIPDECTTEADCDCDGDVDGVDFAVFASCFNKAGNPPRTAGCPPAWALGFDQDKDGDIDGIDFSVFASCFNKAGNPPRSPCNTP